jgi:DNA polymerase-3 subunit beta
VPRKGVVELQRLLDDDSVKIFIGTNHIRVIGGDYQFTSKLVDGAYPDYDRVLPKGGDKVIQADRLELKGAFGRAAILSNEKYRGVRLSISEDSLKIVANNPEQEEAQEDMEVNYKGEALEIGFNVSYLLDVFNTLEQRDIKMTLLNSNSSVLIESVSDESALYVVMPMRL